jgi:hypothetical protein
MAKTKKPAKEKPAPEGIGASQPMQRDELRQPANPPRPNMLAFLVALAAFFVWFVYLVCVAAFG